MRSAFLSLFVVLAALPFTLTVRGQSKTPYTAWSDYGGSADSMPYSALKKIHNSNVDQLQQAWFYAVPAFTASYYGNLDPSNISTFQGKVENQGYYVFTLRD